MVCGVSGTHSLPPFAHLDSATHAADPPALPVGVASAVHNVVDPEIAVRPGQGVQPVLRGGGRGHEARPSARGSVLPRAMHTLHALCTGEPGAHSLLRADTR